MQPQTVNMIRHSGPIELVYRNSTGLVREAFGRTQVGAAMTRGEFINRVEDCSVIVRNVKRLVRCVS